MTAINAAIAKTDTSVAGQNTSIAGLTKDVKNNEDGLNMLGALSCGQARNSPQDDSGSPNLCIHSFGKEFE